MHACFAFWIMHTAEPLVLHCACPRSEVVEVSDDRHFRIRYSRRTRVVVVVVAVLSRYYILCHAARSLRTRAQKRPRLLLCTMAPPGSTCTHLASVCLYRIPCISGPIQRTLIFSEVISLCATATSRAVPWLVPGCFIHIPSASRRRESRENAVRGRGADGTRLETAGWQGTA